ncbi:MAG: T9SS type A sorting domain-containing protein [Crocinitomicaceae bacterium]|nr:T9SS type A sorting domain-containing protein [Crocinitomicaceae bacterium]
MKKKLFTLSSFLFLGATVFGQAGLPVSQAAAKKVAVLEELTGKACQFCPDGHRIANEISAANPGKVILVNIHAGGYANGTPNFKTPAGDAIDAFFAPAGYPTGSVQRTPLTGTALATSRGSWASQVSTVLGQDSPANVAMSAKIDAATRILTVKVEIFYTEAQAAGTKHYLNVGMLQDGLTSTQSGASANPSAVLPNGQYEHMHMFRGYVSTGGTWGDQITADQTGVITKEYEFTIPAAINANTVDISKLSFFAILHKGKNTTTTSQIITGAQVEPTFINVQAGKINVVSVVGEYNVGCDDWTAIQPQLKVQNTGATVNSLKFEYTVDGVAKGQFVVNQAVQALQTVTLTLPTLAYVTSPNALVGIKLIGVDNATTGIGTTDFASTNVKSAVLLTDPNIVLEILTDNYPSETSGRFFKETFSNSVLNFGPYVGNGQNAGGADALAAKSHNIVLSGTGCYSLRLTDSYGDGFSYGTNTNGGMGYRIKQNGAVIVSNLAPTFDYGFFKDFVGLVKMSVLGTNELENQIGLNIYPNPTRDEATIELNLSSVSTVKYEVVNMLGQILSTNAINNAVGNVQETINTSNLSAGQYIVNVFVNDAKTQKFLTVVK